MILPTSASIILTLCAWFGVIGYDVLTTTLTTDYIIAQVIGVLHYSLTVGWLSQSELRRSFVFLVMTGGVISVCLTVAVLIGLSRLYSGVSSEWVYVFHVFVSAATEELAKVFAYLVSVSVATRAQKGKMTVGSKREVLVLATAVGLGFQVIENFKYLRLIEFQQELAIPLGAIRTLPMFHSLLVGASALKLWTTSMSVGLRPSVWACIRATALPSVIHFAWNFAGLTLWNMESRHFSLWVPAALVVLLLVNLLVFKRFKEAIV